MASMEEMNYLKPMDKVTQGVMNEYAGRNESERISSLEMVETQWLNSWIPSEGSILFCTVTNTRTIHWRGGSDDMQTRIWYANGETLLIPVRNYWKQGRSYNRTHGKVIEDERESDGVIVAMKLRNGSGAKYPCCKTFSLSKSEAGLS